MEQLRKPEDSHVFISHRRLDTKNNLTSLFYNALVGYGLQVYLGQDECGTGNAVCPATQIAINSASVLIALLSPHYAESASCLNEICWMLRSFLGGKAFILVLCDVEHGDLAHIEKGRYAKAFERHQSEGIEPTEVTEKWKTTLKKVSEMPGLLFKTPESDYGKFVNEIVNRVIPKVKWPPLEVTTHPVGLDQSVRELDDHIQQQSSTKVVGIAGVRGIGKSTLVKYVFNLRRSKFSRASYLFNVRKKDDLTSLQQQLLRDLRGKDWEIPNTNVGKTILKRILKGLKVLIVLDGVEDWDTIETVLDVNAMEPGSQIFITSRNKDILRDSSLNTSVYEVKPLKKNHARELFCHHAFDQSNPFEGYEVLLDEILKDCQGLPLSLKVSGEQLAGLRRLERRF